LSLKTDNHVQPISASNSSPLTCGCNSIKTAIFSLDWLESNNRLLARDVQEPDYLHEEEISELMAVDDSPYDDLEEEVEEDVSVGEE
jgi:hypothetical protein